MTVGRIDLHTHSDFSDGDLAPRDLVRTAARMGLVALSITDHDTLDGTDQALAAGEEFSIGVIPGVELSVDHEDGSLHLLAYEIDHRHPQLTGTVARLRSSREQRNGKIVDRLNELGYSIKLEEVERLSTHGTFGRAHIAQALVASGQVQSSGEAFAKLLRHGGPAYVERYRLPLWDAIGLIHQAGGAAVWAHPGSHGERTDTLLSRLPQWVEHGLDGIESDYNNHTLALRDRLRELALGHRLIYTGGSDFHGLIKPENRLGEGPEGEPIGDECIIALDARVAEIRRHRSGGVASAG